MQSHASIGTHPIHPMLIAFPIAFLSGGVVFDLMSRLLEREQFYTTAQHCLIAGIATGFVAAIPGLMDYRSIIPRESAAKRTGLMHMVVNTTALLLFILSVGIRPGFVDRTVVSIIPAYLGLALLGLGGWLGGSLVYDHKVGVPESPGESPRISPSMTSTPPRRRPPNDQYQPPPSP